MQYESNRSSVFLQTCYTNFYFAKMYDFMEYRLYSKHIFYYMLFLYLCEHVMSHHGTDYVKYSCTLKGVIVASCSSSLEEAPYCFCNSRENARAHSAHPPGALICDVEHCHTQVGHLNSFFGKTVIQALYPVFAQTARFSFAIEKHMHKWCLCIYSYV